jgi:hypothetical protein
MYKAIENLLNLVILVIIIIMTILVAMMVFAYFLLYPVMPIIMTTLRFLAQSVFRPAFTSFTDSFCVFPGKIRYKYRKKFEKLHRPFVFDSESKGMKAISLQGSNSEYLAPIILTLRKNTIA